MEEFWILISVAFFVTNSLDKAKSVQLEELPLQTFDEIFGEGWWDKDKADEWDKLTLEHNVLHQIDRQNTQIGQIEPNSTDQLGQIKLISTDLNPPLNSEDAQNKVSSNKSIAEDKRKRKIIDKFNSIKEEFKEKGKYSSKEWNQIEMKIAKHLKANRKKIYKWKKEFGFWQKVIYEKEDRKHLVEKFDQIKAELKRYGIKNSYPNQINETVAKKLGLSFVTIYTWKRELGQTTSNKHVHSKQKELLMKRYYEIKDKTPKISDKDIAKILKIGSATLFRWKRQFKRQQFHPKSVDSGSI